MPKDLYVNIALNLPINKLFTYKVPEKYINEIEIGKRAFVPFGKKTLTGIIISIQESSDVRNIKEIKKVIDNESIYTHEMILLSEWISNYYLSPIGRVLFSSINKDRVKTYYFLTENYKEKLDSLKTNEEIYSELINLYEDSLSQKYTCAQIEKKLKIKSALKYIDFLEEKGILRSLEIFDNPVKEKTEKRVKINFNPEDFEYVCKENKVKSKKQLEFLKKLTDKNIYPLAEISKLIGITSSSVSSLYKKELITIEEVRVFREQLDIYSEDSKDIILNEEQQKCLSEISDALEKNIFSPFLLYGITGSGKTEVYINAIEKALSNGKTALVLVPETSLTPQLVHRFRKKFGKQVGVIHGKISEGVRYDTYHQILKGEYKIIVGSRSALFAPLRNIGIIIVDEEHDSSYKQEYSFKYNSRDTAIVRAKMNNAVVVLGSGTPSLESYYNCEIGKYKLLELTKRASNINPPIIKIVDLKTKEELDDEQKDIFQYIDKVKVKFLSKELIVEIGERLDKKEKVIILQNRRGYHAYLECVKCGNVEKCSKCSIPFTYYASINLLRCNFCRETKNVITKCSECGCTTIIPKGTGTERVEEKLKDIFPKAIIQRVDTDSVTNKKYQQILKDFYDGKIDVLVGTQMISKGLDFPEVTLVGVINADIGLLNPDFRATEKTFQILTQVSGRSGRSEKKGEVLIQTNHPEFYVFEDVKNHNYKDFYQKELKSRKEINYPPFSRVAVIETKSKDRKLSESKIKEIYNLIIKIDKNKLLFLFPPTPPLFSKLNNYYRYHILIKSSKETDPSGNYLIKVLKAVSEYSDSNINSKVRLSIDVDAINLL
jgi:primosomal protein N' (replication factor Y) (superfamily II helicase)